MRWVCATQPYRRSPKNICSRLWSSGLHLHLNSQLSRWFLSSSGVSSVSLEEILQQDCIFIGSDTPSPVSVGFVFSVSDLMRRWKCHCATRTSRTERVKTHGDLTPFFFFPSSSKKKENKLNIFFRSTVRPYRTTDPVCARFPWCSWAGPDTSVELPHVSHGLAFIYVCF